MTENVDNTLLTEVLKEIRNQLRDQGQLLSRVAEILNNHIQRFNGVEQRIAGSTAELEMVMRSEMLGAKTNFDIQWENKLHTMDERISALEDGRRR